MNRAIRLGRHLLRLLAALLLAGASAKALAGSADLEGTLAYGIDGDHITVEIERISNNTSDTTTGRLYITVWMTVDSNLRTRGYRVARLRIIGSSDGTLKPGQYFSDLRWTLAYQAPPPGTYYIHFYTSQDPETNTVSDSHTFTSTVEVGQSDDHGNSRDSAKDVSLSRRTPGVIDPGNDTDYFQFAVSARGAVVMESSGRLDIIGTLFDAKGSRLVQDDDGAGYPNFRIERTLDAGTYYVRVHSYQTATGGYTLHLRTGSEGGGDKHGNSRDSARAVSLPSRTPGVIDAGNDTDYFQFAVSARGAVVMESSGRLDIIGTLFDAKGSRLVQDDDGAGYPNFRIERTLDAGTYYVRVHSYQTATGGYTLHLRTGSEGGGDKHGNSRDSARAVSLPSRTPGVIDAGNDTDYFQFAVLARGAVVMESRGRLDTVGTLFDAKGNRIVQDDDGAGHPNFRIEQTLDAGTYYIRVHSFWATTGDYTLCLRVGQSGGLASRPMSALCLDEAKIPVTEVTMTDDKLATLLTIPRRSRQIASRPPGPCDSVDGGGDSRRTHRRCAPPPFL